MVFMDRPAACGGASRSISLGRSSGGAEREGGVGGGMGMYQR